MGLGNTTNKKGVPPVNSTTGTFRRLNEVSAGKDTTTGHWELNGDFLEESFAAYPNGVPSELIGEFERKIGRESSGNYTASGTEIIEQLDQEHIQTGKPIVYASAGSVFQIAAHVEVILIEELYSGSYLRRSGYF